MIQIQRNNFEIKQKKTKKRNCRPFIIWFPFDKKKIKAMLFLELYNNNGSHALDAVMRCCICSPPSLSRLARFFFGLGDDDQSATFEVLKATRQRL